MPGDAVTVTVHGADTLAATLHGAAGKLGNLSGAHASAAQAVVQAAQGLVPVRTGTLRASIWGTTSADRAIVTAGAPYAGYVHARTPFLTAALDQTRAAILTDYGAAVADTVDTVKGK